MKRKAAAITNPVATFTVNLPRNYTLRVVVWETQEQMHANTSERRRDYAALFQEESGRCVGTMSFSLDDIVNGTRAHEIRHAVDAYGLRVYGELLCQVTESITNEVDATLRSLAEEHS